MAPNSHCRHMLHIVFFLHKNANPLKAFKLVCSQSSMPFCDLLCLTLVTAASSFVLVAPSLPSEICLFTRECLLFRLFLSLPSGRRMVLMDLNMPFSIGCGFNVFSEEFHAMLCWCTGRLWWRGNLINHYQKQNDLPPKSKVRLLRILSNHAANKKNPFLSSGPHKVINWSVSGESSQIFLLHWSTLQDTLQASVVFIRILNICMWAREKIVIHLWGFSYCFLRQHLGCYDLWSPGVSSSLPDSQSGQEWGQNRCDRSHIVPSLLHLVNCSNFSFSITAPAHTTPFNW